MEHPINDLLKVSLEKIGELLDVNIVVGDPVIAKEDFMVIPISKVKATFLAGGSEIKDIKLKDNLNLPFGGGTGGNVSIVPVAFLIIKGDDTRILHLKNDTNIADRVIDNIPSLLDTVIDLFKDQAPIEKS